MSDWLAAAVIATAVACGLSGGAFYAFSTFVMPALGRLAPAQGVAAMQSINRTVLTPAFMVPLFGAGAACIALIVVSAVGWDGDHSPWIVAGGALYVVGTILTTMAYNVPRNEALDRLDASGAEAAGYWRTYLVDRDEHRPRARGPRRRRAADRRHPRRLSRGR